MSFVHLPLNNFKNIGGPTTFIKNLAKYFDQNDFSYSSKKEELSSSILFPISHPISELKAYKEKGFPIIQRLDGLPGFIWQKPDSIKNIFKKIRYENPGISLKQQLQFARDMIKIGKIYRDYSDMIIFQSNYCKNICFELMGELPESKYRVIYNGVHGDLFYPSESNLLSKSFTFITSGRFRRNDMLLPLFDALDLIKREGYEFKLKVIGPIERDNLESEARQRSYVELLGPMNQLQMAEELRSSDIYLFASLNAPCPNSLLEAISSGLPVVTYEYGSTPELLSFAPELIAKTKPAPNPLMKSGELLDPRELAEKIKFCIKDYESFRGTALSHRSDYSFEKCGNAYQDVITQLIKS